MSNDSASTGMSSFFGPRLQYVLLVLLSLCAACFLLSDIYATYLNFSPVPIIDAWSGVVEFYLDAQQSPLAFWNQHNDHRIPFAKVLFWLDMRYLDGSGLLLLPVNIVLLLSIGWILSAYAGKLLDFPSPRCKAAIALTLGLIALAWMQHQNIISRFQGTFVLAFLLPLLCFYCFARALEAPAGDRRWYLCSLLCGVASQYCLVNGLLVLPLLALFAALGARSPRQVLAIALVALASLAVFLIGYENPMTSSVGLEALGRYPLQMAGFALVYLGGPFFEIFHSVHIAMFAGAVAVALTVYLFLTRAVYRASPYALALFAYIAYVFATAAMTAFGRFFFGLETAAASRYLTPALTLWAALLILVLARSRRLDRWCWLVPVVVAALLVPGQRAALDLETGISTPHAKAFAALALQLDIEDIDARRMLLLFYTPEMESVFERARRGRVAIFADRYAWPAVHMGTRLAEAGGEPCFASVNFQRLVDPARSAWRFGGTLAERSGKSIRYILFGDEHGIVKGIAFPGRDAARDSGPAGTANFDGYAFGAPDFAEMRCVRRAQRWPAGFWVGAD